jgi:hypothetical protein
MRKAVSRALGLSLLAGAAYAAWRAWHTRTSQQPRTLEWGPAPFPFPPVPRPAAPAPAPAPAPAEAPPWVEPGDDGSCPVSHPIKGKRASGIYHVPGGANYDRTRAERCYADEDAARRDGLRRSKV